MTSWVFVDIDHTLFDSRGRDGMMRGDKTDWDAYNSAAPGDPPVPEVIRMVNALSRDTSSWRTAALTARAEKWRALTMRQLIDHGVLHDELIMRPENDFRPAPVLKVDLVQVWITVHKVDLAMVIDDRDDVVAAFREAGITVLQSHVRIIKRS